MKTKEELCALKEEVEALNKKLHELTEEELAQVTGGYPGWVLDEEPTVTCYTEWTDVIVLEPQASCRECERYGTCLNPDKA